jgi:ribosomal-protein-alanine N-acetyltransferase
MMIISNNNLIITKMDLSMSFDVFKNSQDEDNKRFVPDEVFETEEEAKEIIKHIIDSYDSKDGPFIYAIIRKSDRANIGYVQLVKIDEGWEIGYHIAKAYTGNGYASEAVNLYVEYLKKNTNIKEIYGVALADNLASRRVLEKCGFNLYFEGTGMYQSQKRTIIKTIKKL